MGKENDLLVSLKEMMVIKCTAELIVEIDDRGRSAEFGGKVLERENIHAVF
jgi:hypothetical protein